jgi:hypothetical protein
MFSTVYRVTQKDVYARPYTIDHIIYECVLLKTQRDNLRPTVSKTDSWPAKKNTF